MRPNLEPNAMFRENRFEQLVDGQAGLMIDLLKAHAADAKRVVIVRRRPGGAGRNADFMDPDLESQFTQVPHFAEYAADETRATKADVPNAGLGFAPIEFEVRCEVCWNAQVVAEFKRVVIMKDTGNHESDRFICGVVPEMPANAMMVEGLDDSLWRADAEGDQGIRRDSEPRRKVGDAL